MNALNYSDKIIYRVVLAATLAIPLVVLILGLKILPKPEPAPSFIYYLPTLNAIINGTCSILLLVSFYFIKRKQIAIHKKLNIATLLLSTLFLLSYVTFHYMGPVTKFGGEGAIRYVYFTILITHIIAAAVVLPLVLLSFHRGLQMDVPRHRKLVRYTFPLWLYVTVTGVVVYLMISPYYNFPI